MKNRIASIGIVGLIVIDGILGLFIVTDQVSAPGPTYVSGSIASDTTWILTDSPYIVTGNITVDPSATLVIEPGVEVKFDGVYSIIVDGRLIADGTSMSKIKFTSNQISPAKGDWYTIRLRTDYNLIDNTEVEYASYGIFMTFFGGNNTVSNTTTKYCKFDGIYITNSDNNTISDCTITSNYRYGMTIYESHNTKVKGCIIQYNNFFGINLNASTYTQIHDCNISYNDGKGILFYSDSHNTTISGCEIDWNNHIGIDLWGTSDNNIINTTVIGNNGMGIDFGGVTKNQRIENCTIIGNEGTGIDLRGSSYVDIVGCNVSRNKGKGGIYSGSPVERINITVSSVLNNSAGNGIELYKAKRVNITYSNISGNVGNGIYFPSSILLSYNNLNNCTIAQNGLNGVYFYIGTMGEYSYIQYNNIRSNKIYLNNQNGIYIHSYKSSFPHIQFNNIHSNTIHSNNQNGVYFFSYDHFYAFVQNNIIYCNTIYSNTHNGIYFLSRAMDNYYIQNNDLYSNSIYSNGINGIYLSGFNINSVYWYYIQGNNIYSNLIHSNAQNGIYFNTTSASESFIQHNDIHSNTIYQHNGVYRSSGILLYARNPVPICQESRIYNNTIESNTIGIVLLNMISQVIFTNNISRNNNGIWLEQSSSNILRYNNISYNNQSGITLTFSSNNNIIENNNIASNNKTGILVTDNSNDNLITRNNIAFNAETGLNISDSSGNEIHHNNFIYNAKNAYDSTIALNDWDDGAEGNYWSDYLGTDDDGDGFGEDPYVIAGGGSRDWHPIMIPLNITAPYVIFTSPANGDINVPVDTTISVTFSKEMNTTAVENAISISGGLSPIGFVWDAKNEIVTFAPSSKLTSKTTYTVTITTDARDNLGNRMEDAYMFSFTSEDIEPPEISITSPFDGETNIEIYADVVVTFNEPMQRSTITYSCTPDPGGWSVSWSPDNMIATFSHNDFGSEITYTFQITAGKDTAGNDLVAGSVPNPWLFISEDVIGPEIISTFPVDGSENISTIANIEVNFNEKMDKSSVMYTCAPNPLGWSVTWTNDDTSVIFSHNEFAQKTRYTFQIPGAKDVSGNDLNPSTVANPWSFTTTGDYTAPQISLTSPVNNAVNVDQEANVIVTFSEAMNTSSLNYICIPDPGGTSESWNAQNTVVTISHNPFDSSETYVFQITGANDPANNNLVAGPIPNPWSFKIADVIGPKILSTSPSNREKNVVQTVNVVVKFSEEMNMSSLSFICNPNPGGWSVLWSSGNTIATFTHNPFDSLTNYSFHIIDAKDLAGNDLVSGPTPNPWWFITIDSEGPFIISTSPVNGANNIGLNNNILVTFSEQMNISSITFSCAPDPGGWSTSWGSSDTVAIFSHNAFMDSTTYTFHIANAKDVAGNNLVTGAVPNPWSFTTEDITAPTITATTPPDGANDIFLDQDVIITFSESMDNTTVTFTCLPDPGGWSMVWNDKNTEATYSHNPFIETTTYTFQVTGGKDLAGDSLIVGGVPNPWSFTTQGFIGPQIIATLPINGAIDISLNANIVVTFSKAMDTSSLGYICIPDPEGWSESWSAGNTIVTFSHNPFTSGTIYGFQISSGKDIIGNDLTPGMVANPWSFSTIGKLVAPQITWTSPGNNATNVNPKTNIIVTFSHTIDPSSLNYRCNPDPGEWSENWNADNTVMSLSHDPFNLGTMYMFHITEGKDMDGNDLTPGTVPHSWNFTTISVDSIIVTPSEATISSNGTVVLIAQAYDSLNNPITDISYIWDVNNNLGTVSPQGSQIVTFKASLNVGTCQVNVTAGGKSASAFMTMISEEVIEKEEAGDALPSNILWIWLLIFVIIVLFIINLVIALKKKGLEVEESSEPVGEDANSGEGTEDDQEITEKSESEIPPPTPP